MRFYYGSDLKEIEQNKKLKPELEFDIYWFIYIGRRDKFGTSNKILRLLDWIGPIIFDEYDINLLINMCQIILQDNITENMANSYCDRHEDPTLYEKAFKEANLFATKVTKMCEHALDNNLEIIMMPDYEL